MVFIFYNYIINVLVEIKFTLDDDTQISNLFGHVYRVVIVFQWGSASIVVVAENDSYCFAKVDFDTPVMEKFENQFQL